MRAYTSHAPSCAESHVQSARLVKLRDGPESLALLQHTSKLRRLRSFQTTHPEYSALQRCHCARHLQAPDIGNDHTSGEDHQEYDNLISHEDCVPVSVQNSTERNPSEPSRLHVASRRVAPGLVVFSPHEHRHFQQTGQLSQPWRLQARFRRVSSGSLVSTLGETSTAGTAEEIPIKFSKLKTASSMDASKIKPRFVRLGSLLPSCFVWFVIPISHQVTRCQPRFVSRSLCRTSKGPAPIPPPHDLSSTCNRMSVLGTAWRRSHKGINSTAATAIVDHTECQTDTSSPPVPSRMPSHRSTSTAMAGVREVKCHEAIKPRHKFVIARSFEDFDDRGDRVNLASCTANFRSHPHFQPADSFLASESSTLPDSPQSGDNGDRPHGRRMKSFITNTNHLAIFGWACLANSQSKKTLQVCPTPQRGTKPPHRPTNHRYLPQCLFAFSPLSRALHWDTAGHVWISREEPRARNIISRKSGISRLGRFQTFLQCTVSRTSAMSWVES